MHRLRPLLATVSFVLLTSACDVEVLHDLQEGDANGVIETLAKSGVAADKLRIARGGNATYTVAVPRQDAARAIAVLQRHGLPKPPRDGLGKVFGKSSLVPTLTQQRAMLRHALAEEVARTLETLGGVSQARVHLVLPERDPLADPKAERPQPRAAVVLRVFPKFAASETKIKKVVAGAVHALDEDRVSIMIDKIAAPAIGRTAPTVASVGPFQVASQSRVPLAATLAILALLACGTTAAWLLGLRKRRQTQLPTQLTQQRDLNSSLSMINSSLTGAGSRSHRRDR